MKTNSPSTLLDLLDARWRETIQHLPDVSYTQPFKRPTYVGEMKAALRGIARDHAEANNSDPFAGARALHYMRQGYSLPSEVREDAHGRTQARRAQGVTFPAVKLEIAA